MGVTTVAQRAGLVTGASRGIGRAIATRMAKAGFGLTISSRRLEDLEALADELRFHGAPLVRCAAVDLSSTDGIDGLVAAHNEAFTSMDALIANAGFGIGGGIADFSLKRLEKLFQVNVASSFELIKQSLPSLRKSGAVSIHGAKVVAITSITGVYPERGLAAYGATKAALISLIEALNLEEGLNGVAASAVAPGYVNTDMSDWVSGRIPVEEMISVDDVASVVEMLLSLGRWARVPRVVMTRAGSSGFEA